jgi:hypothetical protein
MTTHILPKQEVVGKFDRTGDKTLNLQQFFAMSLGLSVENIYYIAIAVLACILGAEIAGICMLIGKLRRARSGKNDAQNDEFNMGGGANYAIAAISFGAVSATLELALLVLAITAAVGAFVLCALLVVLYAKGYLLISKKVEKTAQEQPATPAYAAQEETYEEVADEQYTEEPDYTDYTESDVDAQQAIDELMDDGVEDTAVVTEAPNTAVVENAQTVERTVITQGAPVYGGQAPVIEKHIIETTREIIKETNTTTVTEDKNTNPVTEEMRKAIDELKQLGLQLRMEREVAVVHPVQENGEAIDADEDELDELDAEDELDVEDEAEREADAEENDDEYESDLFGNERIVGFDEETGCYIIARYRKSCEAKLMQSRPATKKYYSAIRNALMGYEGTKERMSWSIDTYTNDHTQIAKINIRPRTLDLYLALEPSTLEDSVYRGRDVGGKKKYAETPFLYKVNSPRKLALALELVQRTCEEQGLSPIDIEEVNYEEQYPFTDTETLITRGLIREYLREEKPAATFELDPDHVPQLAEEDETVIPANANFTWEFDNDQPEVVEVVEEEPVATEEPIEEPVAEEVVVEEPVPAAPVSGTTTTTTTHETIRTTERHYTERYYSTGTQINAIEETRTVEVLPEATAEPVEAEAEEVVEENSEVQSAVAALFGDDVNQEDEPIVDEPAPEVVEEVAEEEIIEEVYEEETVEEPEEIYEEVVEVEEEIVEEEPVEEIEEEIVEEYYEEEPEAEGEEEYYEEVVEEYYEEEPEAEEEEYYEEVVEEYYEEEPEAEEEEYYEEVVEEYYEEEPEAEGEEEYYEEVVEEYYEEEPQEEYEEEYFDEELVEEYYEEEEVEEEIVEEVEEEVEEEVVEEEPAPQPVSDVVLLDVCLFDDYFDNGAIINLETLKQVGLAHEGATRLKVYASGALKGQFTVEANHFTLDAIKAIGDADGDSIMIR